LEAPPNDRPSTPGLGASQPLTNEQASEVLANDQESNCKDKISKISTEQKAVSHSRSQVKSDASPEKPSEMKKADPAKTQEFLSKRSSVFNTKDNAKDASKDAEHNEMKCGKPSLPPAVGDLAKSDESIKQVKSPIKILKNSDGRYQVLRGPSAPTKTGSSPDGREAVSAASMRTSPSALVTTPAEFSVVSIGDSTNSNGVKITLKQCQPGSTNNSSNTNSKKPKVISNVLLRNSTANEKANANNLLDQMQDMQKQEKQKRKVTFMDVDSNQITPSKSKKIMDQTDKKQFLHSFRLTSKQTTASAQVGRQQRQDSSKKDQSATIDEDANSVEAQVRNILKSSNRLLYNRQFTNNKEDASITSTAKKRQADVKITPSNITERSGDTKSLVNSENNSSPAPSISNSNEQQKQQQSQAQQQQPQQPQSQQTKVQQPQTQQPQQQQSQPKQPQQQQLQSKQPQQQQQSAAQPPQQQQQQQQQQQTPASLTLQPQPQPQQQPIDVYAFPNDPPTVLPAGAVKRKCPPGLPIFEVRKKQQYQTGKRAGVNTGRGGAVKCYRNQSAKAMIYSKPATSPARVSVLV
jgi:hypothetical protein